MLSKGSSGASTKYVLLRVTTLFFSLLVTCMSYISCSFFSLSFSFSSFLHSSRVACNMFLFNSCQILVTSGPHGRESFNSINKKENSVMPLCHNHNNRLLQQPIRHPATPTTALAATAARLQATPTQVPVFLILMSKHSMPSFNYVSIPYPIFNLHNIYVIS